MYAWSKEKSTRDNGYILGLLGCMSVVVLIVTKILARRYEYTNQNIFKLKFFSIRFQDRVLMLSGMVISFLGYFVFLPWGSDYPSIQMPCMKFFFYQ
jgi:hypothetical protein